MKEPSNAKLADLRRVCCSIRKFCGVPLHFRLFVGLRSQSSDCDSVGCFFVGILDIER